MTRNQLCNTLDLGFQRQLGQLQQHNTHDGQPSQDDKFAEILVLRDQYGPILVSDSEHIGVRETRALFNDAVDGESVFPQPLDDRARDVLVGQEVHAYSAASGLVVPTSSAA